MNRWIKILGLVATVGCSHGLPADTMDADQPLRVEQWKLLSPVEKYAPETLDRLRSHDDSLGADANWDEFMRTVVVEQRRRDIPSDY